MRTELRIVCAHQHGVLANVGREHGELVVRSKFLNRKASAPAPLTPEQFMACRGCRLVYHVSGEQILKAIESGDRVLFPVAQTGVLD